MKCDYCGYENKSDVTHCAFCGVELEKVQSVWQEEDSGYAEYQKESESQDRRRHWEKMFRTGQSETPSWRKEGYREHHMPLSGKRQDGEYIERHGHHMPVSKKLEQRSRSLGRRLKQMPVWMKCVLIVMLFSRPAMALLWLVIWLIYEQFWRR